MHIELFHGCHHQDKLNIVVFLLTLTDLDNKSLSNLAASKNIKVPDIVLTLKKLNSPDFSLTVATK